MRFRLEHQIMSWIIHSRVADRYVTSGRVLVVTKYNIKKVSDVIPITPGCPFIL